MEKPILIARRDFVNDLFHLINHSGLPAFLVEYILRDVLAEVGRTVQGEFHQQEHEIAEQQKETNEQPDLELI